MKVVCIAGFSARGYGNENLPEIGKVYSLREIGACEVDGTVTVLLAEIVNLKRDYASPLGLVHCEPGFAAYAFRPVQPRATDISIFTAMLTTKHKEEPSPVVTSDHEVPA